MKKKQQPKIVATEAQSRKARRKQDRQKRKRGVAEEEQPAREDQPSAPPAKLTSSSKESKRSKEAPAKSKKQKVIVATKEQFQKSPSQNNDPYAHLDATTAAALRRDDEEIAYLERSLGMTNKKQKERLGKEFAKLEGYGDDFGDFLDDLDGMVHRIAAGVGGDYGEGDDDDDQEASDFDEMLSGEDEEGMPKDEEEDSDDEMLPMKDPEDIDEDDSVMDELEADESVHIDDGSEASESEEESNNEDEEEDVAAAAVAANNANPEALDTYRPIKGEDIYGKKTQTADANAAPTKYMPPHLRKQQEAESNNNAADDKAQQAAARQVRRALNQILNRLSEDNIATICQDIAQSIYPSYPTSVVNESLWHNTKNACVAPHLLMSGLIPGYMAAVTGVHYLKGDTAQLGEYLIEQCVVELWEHRNATVSGADTKEEEPMDPISDKSASNLALALCYLYNFGVVHCTLLYDLIREFIVGFSERDIELLLLILSHSGRSLRTDDPTALKDIVLLVQKRALDVKGKIENYSRVDYMVSAMNDLKNNKRRKQDEVFVQKTTKLRKMLGQIKSIAAKTSAPRADSCLRLSLSDILNAGTKGRWWKIGASWAGNQYQYAGDESTSRVGDADPKAKAADATDEEQARLLKLAAKYRMNTDVRRSIFCIIMGSADCEDAFEKLVRAGMLKGRNERETVRVLMECCGGEKEFNKLYAYLAARLVEYQPQCKFSFQLAFWDMFKQFDDMKLRKAANYAKLLFQLVVVHRALKLNVLKAIDLASPDELPEAAMIFSTLFFSAVFDYFDSPSDVMQLFQSSISQRKASKEAPGDDDLDALDEGDALRASITIFFVRILKSSPKYTKGSKFRANLKAALKTCDTDGMMDE